MTSSPSWPERELKADEQRQAAESLQVSTEKVDGAVVVSAVGEVDSLTAHLLRDELNRQLDATPARLVVDLSRIEFLGSVGLSALVAAAERGGSTGVALHLVAGRTVRRVIDATGLHPVLTVHDDVAGALVS